MYFILRGYDQQLHAMTRGGSRTAATSKIELFVIIANGFPPLTIITISSILYVAAVLDPPMMTKFECKVLDTGRMGVLLVIAI